MPKQPGNVQALGEAFRRQRAAARLSQEELALKTGMSQRKYSRIEGGEITDPGLADIVQIGKVFGFTPNEAAELAGLWHSTMPSGVEDERWKVIVSFLAEASPTERTYFLSLGYALALATPRLVEQSAEKPEWLKGNGACHARAQLAEDQPATQSL